MLYWSARGQVACEAHAPQEQSARWVAERWAAVPGAALGRRRVTYQCQYCSPLGTALRRIQVSRSNPRRLSTATDNQPDHKVPRG